jgi:hypothetical protein
MLLFIGIEIFFEVLGVSIQIIMTPGTQKIKISYNIHSHEE